MVLCGLVTVMKSEYFCTTMNKLISLIPIGVALYYVYQNNEEQKKFEEELNKRLEDLKKQMNSQLQAVEDSVDTKLNPISTAANDNNLLKITPEAYFHSISDSYWDAQFMVKISNNTKYVLELRGIRIDCSFNGYYLKYLPWWSGNMKLQSGQSYDLWLGGVNLKQIAQPKATRSAIRKYLESVSKGVFVKMFSNVEVLLQVSGTQTMEKGVRMNIEGRATVLKNGASNPNPASSTWHANQNSSVIKKSGEGIAEFN